MKRNIILFLFLFFTSIVLVACIQDDKDNDWFSNQVATFTIEQSNTTLDSDFELPNTFGEVGVTWTSNLASITIAEENDKTMAKVTRGTTDQEVTLTATLTYQEFSEVKTFKVTVLKLVEVNEDVRTVRLNVTIPAPLTAEQTLTIGSNVNGWNPANLEYAATKISDTVYRIELEFELEESQTIAYKWTIQMDGLPNAWSMVEREADGVTDIADRQLSISSESDVLVVVDDVVGAFADPNVVPEPTVVGNLELIEDFTIPQLDRTRTIRVWTPSNYDAADTSKKYSVIYMQDAQNLFDATTSFAGEWQVDETIEALISEDNRDGFIVVGIDNSSHRMNEYTPDWSDKSDADGSKYAAFIVETLKPYIDEHYNTLTDRENTAVAGSSMGGLISFHIGLKYPEVFGAIGAFSSSFQINTEEARNAFIESINLNQELPRLYLDAGTNESLYTYVNPVADKLFEVGYPKELIYTHIEEGHGHNEFAWRTRFPNALDWLFSDEEGNYVEAEQEITLNVYLPEKSNDYFNFLNKPEASLYAYTGSLASSHILTKVSDTHYQATFVGKPNSSLSFKVLYYLAGADGIQIFENNLDGSTKDNNSFETNNDDEIVINHTVESFEISATLTVNVTTPAITVPEGETLMMGLYNGIFGGSWRDSQMTTITDTSFTFTKNISSSVISLTAGYVLFKEGASSPYFQKFERFDGQLKTTQYTLNLPTFNDWDGVTSFEFTIDHVVTDETINY